MKVGTLYALFWIAWLALFVAIEGSALVTGHNDYTLSDYVWRLEQLGRAWTVLRFFVTAFCVWLALHMAFGWFR